MQSIIVHTLQLDGPEPQLLTDRTNGVQLPRATAEREQKDSNCNGLQAMPMQDASDTKPFVSVFHSREIFLINETIGNAQSHSRVLLTFKAFLLDILFFS